MGEILATVTLENTTDRGLVSRGFDVEANVRQTTINAIVDTGAVGLVLPEEVVDTLGLERVRTRTVVYADERREKRPVAGPVTVEIGNLAMDTECIVGVAGSEALIGQTVLEVLDLVADCRNRTLTPRHPDGPLLALRRQATTAREVRMTTQTTRRPADGRRWAAAGRSRRSPESQRD